MGYRIAVRNGDFRAIFASAAKESSDYAFLLCGPSEGVVEDGENGLDRTLAVWSRPQSVCAHTCGCTTTLTGAVDGCCPLGVTGPRGLAKWRKESGFAMVGRLSNRDCVLLPPS